MGKNTHFDFVVIGSGPAGQKAAIQAAKGGASVAIIERTRAMGGECVRRGTIPSKTLRECAARLTALRRQAGFFDLAIEPGRELDSLITGVDDIVGNHVGYMTAQLERNGIDCVHGRAAFVDAHTVEVTRISGAARRLTADHIIIATGSRPRRPP
ncbi:MAG: NAD(P) transhydrogenase, partial [Myxococcota bacterium]